MIGWLFAATFAITSAILALWARALRSDRAWNDVELERLRFHVRRMTGEALDQSHRMQAALSMRDTSIAKARELRERLGKLEKAAGEAAMGEPFGSADRANAFAYACGLQDACTLLDGGTPRDTTKRLKLVRT